ncbi:MAG: pentapeptide repeat-containing protein [Candidatus Dormibacteria bacterium]
MPSLLLFKVLDAQAKPPYHSGRRNPYELPEGRHPGQWTESIYNPKVHVRGYHLTRDPALYWKGNNRLFIAQVQGQTDIAGDKVACESVRLLEEVGPEWSLLPLYPEIRALLAWRWRMENPEESSPPKWANLSRLNISRAKLSRIVLSGLRCTNLNAAGADLTGAALTGSILTGANFRRAVLKNLADTTGAECTGADFRGADLSGTDWSNAILVGAHISPETVVHGARFTRSQIVQLGLTAEQRKLVRIVPDPPQRQGWSVA